MPASKTMSASHEEPAFSEFLTVRNQMSELARVALWLEQMARRHQLEERTVFKLDIVLNEALPNIISYAYADQLRHEILIRLDDRGDDLLLEIIDDGVPFDPFAAPPLAKPLTLDSASINGRGIHLIKSFTDAQEYLRIDGSNKIRLTIHKTPESKRDSAPGHS